MKIKDNTIHNYHLSNPLSNPAPHSRRRWWGAGSSFGGPGSVEGVPVDTEEPERLPMGQVAIAREERREERTVSTRWTGQLPVIGCEDRRVALGVNRRLCAPDWYKATGCGGSPSACVPSSPERSP